MTKRAKKAAADTRFGKQVKSFRDQCSHFPKKGKKRFLSAMQYSPEDYSSGNLLSFHLLNFWKMLEILIAIWLGLAVPGYTTTTTSDGTGVTTETTTEGDTDTGGETGHIPPKPPTPPAT
jgi:hypothetical protein